MGRHDVNAFCRPPTDMDDGTILATIRRCWERTFPALPFDADLRWQDSGADSLSSMHLMLRLEEALGRPVPFDLLTRDTTAAGLAVLLAGDGVAAAPGLPLVFLIPGLLGDEPRLADFRRATAHAMRFHTLALPDIDAPAALLRDVRRTASRIADEIAEVQPEGAVMIAGYSFGGILAYDVSALLAERGRPTALLGLLDPFLRIRANRPLVVEDLPGNGARLAAGNPLSRAEGQGAGDVIERLRFGASFVLNRLDAARRHLIAVRGHLPPETLYWRRQRLIGRLRWQALKRWRPRVNQAPALLVTSDEATRHYDIARWLRLLPHAEHLPVGGTHLGLFGDRPLAMIAPAFAARVTAAALAVPRG